jgi:CheY-like chemotaxis protein/anti-sigma regulatory factor (Ser/Thr protein kinase)
LNVRPVELLSVIEAAIETVRPAADAKEIRFQSVLDPTAGPVAGDFDRLQQIVWNLLSNAIKFTPKGGRVMARLERMDCCVEITITDTGKGISREFVPYVFERFRQADSSSTRVYSGLGLGLAIVRQLVELHGGTVRAESEGEGKGATFTVKLPLIPIRVERHPGEHVHPTVDLGVPFDNLPALNGVRVLIVDDEADSREFLVAALEQCEAKVFAAASVSEALEGVSQFKPDVLVSDIGMPLEDGYSLIRKVRKLSAEQGGEIPAIALTAYARAEDRMRAIAAGFQMHIPKPVEPAELATVVASLARPIARG